MDWQGKALIAALYVETNGVYFGLEDVQPFDYNRGAQWYIGPYPVVAHPPCERWGRYWGGGPSAKVKRALGDDGGLFLHALTSVRRCGGVLEHPEGSHAFRYYGLITPPKAGGWIVADPYGYACCVEQGHYGHAARKATWLYAVRTARPELKWGKAEGKRRLDEGFRSTADRKRAREAGQAPIKRLSRLENLRTPPPFRDLLLELARSV